MLARRTARSESPVHGALTSVAAACRRGPAITSMQLALCVPLRFGPVLSSKAIPHAATCRSNAA
eukprot:7886483-Prorocentrum_lima.AAC.1